MKPLVINLLGGPGTGKSTTAAGVFSLLKLRGIDVELVTEFAKDLTWEERWKTLDDQLYVTAKQFHKIWRLTDVSVIITDSPIIQGLIYTPESYLRKTIRNINNLSSNYNIFLERVKPYQEKGRSQTEEEAKQMDNNIVELLNNEGLAYTTVPADHTGINIITTKVLDLLETNYKNCGYEIIKINGED
jgi:hypothetical protein